jgi:histidyl-tRNA synthetase
MFRHERPQRGRYRQFHQIGAEALGFPGAELDVELILLADALWKELGLTDVRLELNSLGQPEERKLHRASLIAYFEAHSDLLDEEAKRRLHSNPLRLLDSKNPAMQAMLESAPQLMDFLGEASLRHFNSVKAMLDASGVAYRINPRLVRGMDYYNLTVFEFVTQSLGSQGTICGGGRYDYLIEQIGGKPAPAVGWALGVERVLELIKEQGKQMPMPVPDAYAIIPETSALPIALKVLQQLRAAGVSVQMHAGVSLDGMGSMKSQFKKADTSGARFALIFGSAELEQGCVAIKPLRGLIASDKNEPPQSQTVHQLAEVAKWAQNLRS